MKCPKCEEGTIKKVIFKQTSEAGFLCRYCGTIWIEGEEITMHSGHPFDMLTQGNAVEYILENTEEKDHEHRSAEYSPFK